MGSDFLQPTFNKQLIVRKALSTSAEPKPSEAHTFWRGLLLHLLTQFLVLTTLQVVVHYAAGHVRDRKIYHYLIIYWKPQTQQQVLSSALVFGSVAATMEMFLVDPYLRWKG